MDFSGLLKQPIVMPALPMSDDTETAINQFDSFIAGSRGCPREGRAVNLYKHTELLLAARVRAKAERKMAHARASIAISANGAKRQILSLCQSTWSRDASYRLLEAGVPPSSLPAMLAFAQQVCPPSAPPSPPGADEEEPPPQTPPPQPCSRTDDGDYTQDNFLLRSDGRAPGSSCDCAKCRRLQHLVEAAVEGGGRTYKRLCRTP